MKWKIEGWNKRAKRGENKREKINKGKNYDKIWHFRGEKKIYFPPICTVPPYLGGGEYHFWMGGEENELGENMYIPMARRPLHQASRQEDVQSEVSHHFWPHGRGLHIRLYSMIDSIFSDRMIMKWGYKEGLYKRRFEKRWKMGWKSTKKYFYKEFWKGGGNVTFIFSYKWTGI